jgi:hypothetical protein
MGSDYDYVAGFWWSIVTTSLQATGDITRAISDANLALAAYKAN